MTNSLIFNFNNFNHSIEKGLKYVGNNLYIDIIIDEERFSRIERSKTFNCISKGNHSLYCILYYESNGNSEKYTTKKYEFNIDTSDAIFTLNLYYLTFERGNHGFDFGPGNIPPREKKDRKQGGCYVATCIYGSYDCPQVWTLRRYRDYTLAKSRFGRTFIQIYYFLSPTLVKWFGETKWFKKIITPLLNKVVTNLNKKGIENTVYNDKNGNPTFYHGEKQ